MAAGVLSTLPALPLHEAGKYVAGAYLVVFVILLIYVAIMGIRLSRIERRLGELLEDDGPAPAEAEKLDVAARESTLA
jgi:CcmD family protein